MQNYFETSFGDKIEIISDFPLLYPETKSRIKKLALYYRQVENIRKTDKVKEHNTTLSFKAFVSRYLGALSIISFMEELQINLSYNHTLDIGTGFGVQPMIMKGLGITKQASGVDWIDRSVINNDLAIKKHFKRLKYWKKIEPLVDWSSNSKLLNSTIQDGIKKFGHPRIWARNGSAFTPSKELFYKSILNKNISLDSYITKDFYNLSGRYDLITGFAAIYLFSAEKLISKVSDLLDDDGIFIWNDPYSWYSVPPSFLIGKFPYATQRLTPEDFSRYINIHHKDNAYDMQKVYDHVPQPMPSIKTYLDLAEKFNLIPIGIKRVSFGDDFPLNRGVGPSFLSRYKNTQLHEVVNNIARFRNDISIEDLTTGRVIIAFKRKPRNINKLNDNNIKNAISLKFNSSNKPGPVFNIAKNIAQKIMKKR